jgi:hypothetical protein
LGRTSVKQINWKEQKEEFSSENCDQEEEQPFEDEEQFQEEEK